jgi:hypothetical protein
LEKYIKSKNMSNAPNPLNISSTNDDGTAAAAAAADAVDGGVVAKRQRVLKRTAPIRVINPEYRYYDDVERGFYNKLEDDEKHAIATLESLIKQMNKDDVPIRFKILLSNIDENVKALAIKKLRYMYDMDESSSEYYKISSWIDSLCRLPIGRYAELPVSTKSPMSAIRAFVQSVKDTLDNTVYGHIAAKDQIVRLIAQWITNPSSKGLVIGIGGFKGCGKCLAVDTPVLMADGRTKRVQHVREGDLLMGDDSSPRRVVRLGEGYARLYTIAHVDTAQSYTTNGDHILVLRYAPSGEVREITVDDFMLLPEEEKELYQGICSGIELPGIPSIPAADAFAIGAEVGRSFGSVPPEVQYNCSAIRQEFVRGLASSNPLLVFPSRSVVCFDALVYVFQSLGNSVMVEGASPAGGGVRLCVVNQRYSKIRVSPDAMGMYYGFTLDPTTNQRFMLGNFVVTHNTSLVKNGICKALGLPFSFIALGGASDGSYLDGHSYTYEGSTWGKIVDILIKAKCMNPVIYFDELDKVSYTYKGEEIINILIHITDSTQNESYQDKYFSDLEFDISKCLVIFSYNDENAINPILRDRMVRIQTEGYKMEDKVIIAQRYLIPELLDQFRFKPADVTFGKDVIKYIIMNKIEEEEGVRNLKRALETILSNINLIALLTPEDMPLPLEITEPLVLKYLKDHPKNDHAKHLASTMYC